ncbi:protein SPMIP1-like [Liolophura sinensis]|uniref:protein SPMIP1-like n=1 Tax=Liolophura sinensis TaxID=3198878 RepID=UPI003158650A
MASRNYPANTQIQKFLEEAIHKERDARLAWYFNRSQSDLSSTGDGKSRQYEVFRKKVENMPKTDLLEKFPKDYKPPAYNKKKPTYPDTMLEKAAKDPNLSKGLITAEMNPVPSSTKVALYDGFTKEGKGRYKYLQQRNHVSPEDKFTFPILSSWDIGWRLGDVIKKEDIKKPQYGRTRIVEDTFWTRNGILSQCGR